MPNYTYPFDTDEAVAAFRAAVAVAINTGDAREADRFCAFYESFLIDNPNFLLERPEYATQYNELYQQARWIALPRLQDENDLVDMFRGQVAWLKKIPDYPIADILKEHLLGIDVTERDARKGKVCDALLQNKEKITPPFVAVANKLQRQGTVGDWVSEFLSFMGPEIDSALLLARFTTETDFSKQSGADQSFLRRLLGVVELTRKSSMTTKGFEGGRLLDVDGTLIEFSDGQLSEVENDEIRRMRLRIREDEASRKKNQLKTAFNDPPEYAARIKGLMAGLVQTTGNNPEKLRQAIVTALILPNQKAPNREQVVAAVRAFAAAGDMKHIFGDRQLLDVVGTFLEKEKRTIDADTFKVFPGAPQFIKLFMQVILEGKLGLSENDAAREALQVANILRKKGDETLIDIAYFDDALGVFAFKTPLVRKVAP